ncbi:MAG TPA: DNA polymerase III subunit delta' [Candidatus Angelobacter sp.]
MFTMDSMSFKEFYGNKEVVSRLREMLARERFPHAVILAGPQGAGKYTLALMLARAMNCTGIGSSEHRTIGRSGTPAPSLATDGLPDFCGVCENCRRIGEAADLDARFAEAVEAREGLRETDKRETRILVQPHPDVLVIPPDPPQMMIKVDQVRHVNTTIRYKPAEARQRVFIFTDAAFMKEAANALLKVLEEPPEFATIFLLTRNPGELLPTIRSRSVSFTLRALPPQEIETYLGENRTQWNPRQRQLVARLSGGAVGRALSLNLEEYVAARKDALALLASAARSAEHSDLFHTTETYRGGGEGKEKTDQLVAALYSLLKDLLAINSGAPDMARNTDILSELRPLAASMEFEWIARASQQLGAVQSGMRRNLLRPLSLDAFSLSLER